MAEGYIRQAITAAAAMRALRDNVSKLLGEFKIEHRWSGTRLDIKGPDGEWVEGPNLRGVPGLTGNGWAPVIAVEADGARRVWRVVDWIGGTGPKPEAGQYVGAEGFVETAAEAADIRGPEGDAGPPGPTDWDLISNKPTLFSGDYGDLENKPVLGDAAAKNTGTTAGTVAAGDHTHTKDQVGLGNVDNTSDADKPVSTATQSALDAKVPTTRTLTAGTGIAALGDLSANRTVAIDKATLANLRTAAANKVLTADLIKDGSALVTLTDAATVAIDWEAFVIGDLTLAGNRDLGAPSAVQPGVPRAFFVFGNNSTERSLNFHANYKGDIPDITYTSTRGALVCLTPRTSGLVAVTHVVLE